MKKAPYGAGYTAGVRLYRVSVYLALWLVVFVPMEIRRRRGHRIPPWLHVLLIVAGLMLAIAIGH